MAETVRIDRFNLRVPGLRAEEAQGFGESVARRVAEGLPAQVNPQHLGALAVKVRVPVGTSREQMTAMVVEAILRGIG